MNTVRDVIFRLKKLLKNGVFLDLEAEWREQEQLQKRAQWIHGESDVLGQLRAAGAYAYAGGSSTFCEDNFLHDKVRNA